MKIKVTRIDWDVDEEDEEALKDLPKSFTIDVDLSEDDLEDKDVAGEIIADAISDEYGFCMEDFTWMPVSDDDDDEGEEDDDDDDYDDEDEEGDDYDDEDDY